MNTFQLSAAVVLGLALFSCNIPQNETAKSDAPEPSVSTLAAVPEEEQTPAVNVGVLVQAIDEKRTAIERSIGEPLILNSTDLKEKIKQKWERVDFYVLDDELVRIKTHPYEQVSKRTEEFYLEGGNLILAVIEDDGSTERGKSNDQIDKLYYFHEGEIIKEQRAERETDYNIRASDSEELLGEFQEYLDIYKENKTE